MNKIKRAIIMASGLGTRLHPLTLTVPKPLLRVGGVVMIESIIDGLLANNISEIHIVTGHLKDCFSYLPDKYPNADIDLIFNEYYQECNNISSLYVARNFLDETMIIDGDQIIKNQKVLTPFLNVRGITAFILRKVRTNGFNRKKTEKSFPAVEPAVNADFSFMASQDGQNEIHFNSNKI